MKKDNCYACVTVDVNIIDNGITKSAVYGECRNATAGCTDICPDVRQRFPGKIYSCKVCSNDNNFSFILSYIFKDLLLTSVKRDMIEQERISWNLRTHPNLPVNPQQIFFENYYLML